MPVPDAPGLFLTLVALVAGIPVGATLVLFVLAYQAAKRDEARAQCRRRDCPPPVGSRAPHEALRDALGVEPGETLSEAIERLQRAARPPRPTPATAAYAASVRSAALYARVRPLDPRAVRGSVTPN